MRSEARVAQVVVAVSGGFYALTGLALLFAPVWFFDVIGHFPPFNRHYLGDLGAFTLALGVGLLLAAREPRRHRLLIGAAALASLVHLGNHLYDDWLGNAWSVSHFFIETLPLALIAVALALVWRRG